MAPAKPRRRLIVNADDFGRSHSINEAVIRAHREGILTSASLMVTGDAFGEAVDLARQTPALGVGLHLTLVCGRSVLPGREIPGLVRHGDRFSDHPVRSGFKYFFWPSLATELKREMAAQFQVFRETGLRMDHVNGHLNLHLHPVVFRILMRHVEEWEIPGLRLTRDPLLLNVQLAPGRWLYRLSHAAAFGLLSWWARPRLMAEQIRHTERVVGLLETERVNEQFLLKLLPRLPPGDTELYSHPCVAQYANEFHALVSPKVCQAVHEQQIQLIRYQDL